MDVTERHFQWPIGPWPKGEAKAYGDVFLAGAGWYCDGAFY